MKVVSVVLCASLMGKSFAKDLYALIPLVISGILSSPLMVLLNQKGNGNGFFCRAGSNVTTIFISISWVFSMPSSWYTLQPRLRQSKATRTTAIDSSSKITRAYDAQTSQHHRTAHALQNMVAAGIEGNTSTKNLPGFAFWSQRMHPKKNPNWQPSSRAGDNTHHYEDTENLYRSWNSFWWPGTRAKKIRENVIHPNVYSKDIVSKWIRPQVWLQDSGTTLVTASNWGFQEKSLWFPMRLSKRHHQVQDHDPGPSLPSTIGKT